MATTTLVTFLLRTPPSTRSVSLLGSWDNFTKPYVMEHDTRIGKGHWRGCHTFTNIICDGLVSSPGPARDGGLKMGGTYWYYYQLDDYVDFYNEAEPSTTCCPFLPGQPVNILNVPIYLPSAKRHRSRDSSIGSQRSVDYQTMNPEDKYLNPRTPPRPKLPRLATCPPALPYADSPPSMDSPLSSAVSDRSSSHPRSLQYRRRFRLAGKQSLDLRGLSNSPPSANSLRTAFRNFVSPRPAARDIEGSRGRSEERIDRQHNTRRSITPSRGESKQLYVAGSGGSSRSNSKGPSPSHALVDNPKEFPTRENPGDSPLTIALHSRLGSESQAREPSPLRTAVTVQDSSCDDRLLSNIAPLPHAPLETLDESASQLDSSCVSGFQPDASRKNTRNASPPVDLHAKRLPTLPNSPSSVLEEEIRKMDAANKLALDLNHLESHFSEFSIESPSPTTVFFHGHSRFSAYSTDTDLASPSSMTSSSTFNNDDKVSPTLSISADQLHPLQLSLLQRSPPSTTLSRTSLTLIPSPKLATSPIRFSAPVTLGSTIECPTQSDVSDPSITEPDDTQGHIKPHNDSSNALHLWHDLSQHHVDYPSLGSPFSMYEKSGHPTPRADQSGGHYQIYEEGQKSNVQLHVAIQDLLDDLSYLGDAIVATSEQEVC